MKKYNDFIGEAKLRGTSGVPDRYISNVEGRARVDNGAPVDPREIMALVMRSNELMLGDIIDPHQYMMGRINASQRQRISAIFSQLEDLAESVIRSNYGAILDNIDLDIKLVQPGQVKSFLDENSKSDLKAKPDVDKNNDQQIKNKAKEERDNLNKKDSKSSNKSEEDVESIKSGIDRRKIANNIIQGEAKNTKNILHTDEVKDGLETIFGRQKASQIFSIWDSITKMANKLDWQIPVEMKARMMEDQPGGLAGAVSCEWPEQPKADESQASDIIDSLQNGNDDDDDEPFGLNDDAKDAVEDLFSVGNPKIKVVGIDFPMLLHETVKGIYEMIAAVAIHKDPAVASVIQRATSSYEDEAEDFKYGPYIAADIRDFIFKNNLATEKDNVREFVFGRIMELPDNEFFDLIEKILMSKVNNSDDPSARRKIDNMVSEIVKEISEFELGEVLGHTDNDEDSDEDTMSYDDKEDDNIYSNTKREETMSKSDLERAIDDALDSGDFDMVRKLTKELNERFPDK